MERQPDIYLNVQVDQIELGTNIRGPNVGDTTDIQESIKGRRIEEPLWVRPGDVDGTFVLIDGRRRLTAARAVGQETVPVLLKDVDAEEAIDLMLTSDMRKDQPPLVLDGEGNVIGGLCWAFYHKLETGYRQIDLMATSGVSADVIGAYAALYDDLPELKKAVLTGRLGMTVYALMKHMSPEFKRWMITRKTLSARAVRKEKAEWPVTEARLAREAAIEEALVDIPEDKKEDVRTELEEEYEVAQPDNEFPTAGLLNQAFMSFRLIHGRDLEATDIYILQQIYDFVNMMLDEELEKLLDETNEPVTEMEVDDGT